MKLTSFLLSALLVIAALHSLSGCKEHPVNPGPPDTTSHDFIWYTDTLGGYLSKVRDVCLLSETEAWAVGYFYSLDSTGAFIDSLTTNVARWDGNRWRYIKVNPLFQGHQTFSEVNAVFAFDSNDVWISPAIHWDGHKWEGHDMNFSFGKTRKIWGAKPNDVYFVGDNGSIVHWNGVNLTEMGIVTTAGCRDVWGWDNVVYVAVADYEQLSGSRGYLIRLENGQVKEREFLESREFTTVWGMNGIWYAAGCTGERVYKKEASWQALTLSGTKCRTSIRGTALNNVFVATDEREVYHYNGADFKQILPNEPNSALIDGAAVAGRAIFVVDSKADQAVVYRGYRIK
jgi:hypothetical protein